MCRPAGAAGKFSTSSFDDAHCAQSCPARLAQETKQLDTSVGREARLREELDSKVVQLNEIRTESEQAAEAAAKEVAHWASEVRRLEAIVAAGVEVESASPSDSRGEGAVIAALRAEMEVLREQLATAKMVGMSVQQLRSELSKRGLSPKGGQPDHFRRRFIIDVERRTGKVDMCMLGQVQSRRCRKG